MPIIKSAKKRMKQNAKRRERNFPVRSELKTALKKGLMLIKEGKTDEAAKHLPYAFSIIDKAVKKKIIHPNNAANKKSRLARGLNALQQGGAAPKAEPKAEKAPEKKEEAKA